MSANDSTTSVEYRLIPGARNYRVGDDGSVWTLSEDKRLSCIEGGSEGDWRRLKSTITRGYLVQSIRYDDRIARLRLIHQLILETFIGSCPPGMECCHDDGNRQNNRLGNLRWGTRLENIRDQYRHGTRIQGERHPRVKLNEAAIIEIRSRAVRGEKQRDLACEFGVRQQTISKIVRGEKWAHIERQE